MQDLDTKSIP